MPAFRRDDEALRRLVKEFQGIVEILERWQGAEAVDDAPAGHPEYDLGEVATAFAKIHTELKESGPDGHEVYLHFRAIAHQLRAAAEGLHEK
jgi:hypothetical protein